MFNLSSAIIPTPQYIEDRNSPVYIGKFSQSEFYFDFNGDGSVYNSAANLLSSKMSEFFLLSDNTKNYKITLCVDSTNRLFAGKGKSEAYIIDINVDSACIIGYDEAGAYYGAVSFSSLIHTDGDCVVLPQCHIFDYPVYSKRGHFMENRYGSDFMTLDDWKKGIDYLSAMKINTLVIGLYGCWDRQYDGKIAEYQYIPFKKYPELKTPRHIKYYNAKDKKWIYKTDVLPNMYETDYFGEMVTYGKKKNIDVIPLFNSLGHNTLIPRKFPEISAVDENGNYSGVGFCTNNDKTYEIMFGIYDEIIDRYLTPNGIDSFEIGLDEVRDVRGTDPSDYQLTKSPICKCPKCRDSAYSDLMIEYIIKITKHMKSKGINNVYVYHDMLFKAGAINEDTVSLLKKEGVYDNIIIDWWDYGRDKAKIFGGKSDQLPTCMRSVGKPITGYFHWCNTMDSVDNMLLHRDIAAKKNFEGLIAYSSFDYGYDFNYRFLAECVWNPEAANVDYTLEKYVHLTFPECFNGALRAIRTAREFMKFNAENLCTFFFGYYMSSYLVKDVEYPQNFPARQFIAISEDEEQYLTYLRQTYHKAKYVYDFFIDNSSSWQGKTWAFSAATYMLMCDEFLTVYTCAEEYNKGNIDECEFMSELLRLTKLSDEVISLCQEVRFEANQYIIIRNMSVLRQCVIDLYTYMKSEVQSGRVPEVDILKFEKYLSDFSWFLR